MEASIFGWICINLVLFLIPTPTKTALVTNNNNNKLPWWNVLDQINYNTARVITDEYEIAVHRVCLTGGADRKLRELTFAGESSEILVGSYFKPSHGLRVNYELLDGSIVTAYMTGWPIDLRVYSPPKPSNLIWILVRRGYFDMNERRWLLRLEGLTSYSAILNTITKIYVGPVDDENHVVVTVPKTCTSISEPILDDYLGLRVDKVECDVASCQSRLKECRKIFTEINQNQSSLLAEELESELLNLSPPIESSSSNNDNNKKTCVLPPSHLNCTLIQNTSFIQACYQRAFQHLSLIHI